MTQLYSTDQFFARAHHLRPYEDVPLPVAGELAEIVTDACRWFHDKRSIFLGDPSAPRFPDDVVDTVIEALQRQLDKEGDRRTQGARCSFHQVVHTQWYHLNDLPPQRQRALVKKVWSLRERHRIKVRTWEVGATPPSPSPTLPFRSTIGQIKIMICVFITGRRC